MVLHRAILLRAVAATSVLTTAASLRAAGQISWEDGTPQGFGDTSWSSPDWTNVGQTALGATDGNLARSFTLQTGFAFGDQGLFRASSLGDATPLEKAAWDSFVASNLMLIDFSMVGTNDAATGGNQYAYLYPFFNGPAEAGGGIDSIASPKVFDPEIGTIQANYQINFSPSYYAGVRTHTLAWDYVNAGYDFSKLAPTDNTQNYTLLHIASNTNSGVLQTAMDNIRAYRAKATDPTYTGPVAGADFAVAANWANGAPSGTSAVAVLPYRASTPSIAVSVNSAVTVGSIVMNNTPRSALGTPLTQSATVAPTAYALLGSGSLTLNNGTSEASIVVVDGDNSIAVPINVASDAVIDLAADPSPDGVAQAPATLAVNSINIAAGKTLRTTSIGQLTVNGDIVGGAGSTLTIGGGKTALLGSNRRIAASALNVATSAQLDIGSGSAAIDYIDTSPAASLRAAIASGFAAGAQTGNGIVTSVAGRAVGIAEASSITLVGGMFLGQSVDSTTVLIRATYAGDGNLDGTVNFTDLVSLAQNYNGTGKVWVQGDSNYDGTVNFADLVSLAQNYNKSLAPSEIAILGADFASDFALAQSLVPEPATLSALGLVTAMAIRRRR